MGKTDLAPLIPIFFCSTLFMGAFVPNLAVAQEESGKKPRSTPSKSVRIYRTPEERREAGYGTQLTKFLRFGGVVDLGRMANEPL